MVMRAAFNGDWTFGFFSREAMGHVSVVGFVRRRLDVHKSEKLSHDLLGCWIFDTEPWWLRDVMESRSNRQTCVTSNDGVHVRIFFVV